MKKDPKVFLGHILESIELVEEYAAHATETKFRKKRIPKLVENFIFDCACIPSFTAACIGHVFTHGLLPRRLRLLQSRGACFVKNEVFNQFRYNLQDSIIRRLEIIGEAVKNLPASFKAKHADIPWKQMAGMRDILIHEYFDVDLFLTWKVVKQELPSVKKKLSRILSSMT